MAWSVVLALSVGTAIAGGEPRLAELQSSRAIWNAEGPEAYSYVLRRQCFCTEAATQPIAVTVRGARVVDFAGQAGLAVPEDLRKALRTVPQWFEYVGESQSRRWHSVKVEYHARFGHPTTIAIDRRPRMVDDEVTWTLSNLRALSP